MSLSRLALLLPLLAASVAMTGAKKKTEPQPAAPVSPCPRAAWTPALADARNALLKNDADGVRAFLLWVSGRSDLPALAARTKELAQDPRLQPGQGEPGDLFDLGAEALGDAGLACGACHATSPGPRYEGTVTPPPILEDLAVHMTRHVWALDRLWEGIIGPSDPRWVAGVGALHDHPIDAERLHGREGGESPSDYMDWWIHQPGPSAGLQAQGADRARFYSRMVTACAACHAGTEGAPAVPSAP